MVLRRLSVVLVLVLGVVGLAGPSLAGPPGKWTVISAEGVSNIDEPGLYRTADGTLHVAMPRVTDTLHYVDVAHLTEAGKLTGRTVAVDSAGVA